MAAGKLAQFKNDLGLLERQGILCGEYKDYIITVTQIGREIEFFADARVGSTDAARAEALRSFVKASSHDYKLSSFRMESTGTSITSDVKNASLLLDFIYIYMDKLAELGVPGKRVCSNCGKAVDKPVIVRISEHAHSCDRDCVERLVASSEASRGSQSRPRGSFIGFIGALLGCLIAAVLYIFLGMSGWFCAGAAVLFPIFASYGYSLLGGARSAGKTISVIVLPLVMLALSAFAVLCALVYKNWHELGYVFTLAELVGECVKSLSVDYVRSQFLIGQLGVGCVFLALGWLFAVPDALPKKELPRICEITP